MYSSFLDSDESKYEGRMGPFQNQA